MYKFHKLLSTLFILSLRIAFRFLTNMTQKNENLKARGHKYATNTSTCIRKTSTKCL